MAIDDIYVVKMKSLMFAQDMLNVFFYRQVDTDVINDADGLFVAFDEDVLVYWVDCVINAISVTEVEVFQIATPSDFKNGVPGNNIGTRIPVGGEDRAPSWVAFGFKSNREGPGTRSSFKRFAGLLDEDINSNSLHNDFITLLAVTNLQAAMAGEIVGSTTARYEALQVASGWVLGVPPTENFDINSWADAYLTSQVSRKP